MHVSNYFKRLLTVLLLTLPLSFPGWVFASTTPPATVLVLGDSLSAEYGLARGEGWVALIEGELKAGKDASLRRLVFVNASISGETTAGGRTRLPQLIAQHHPEVVIIELGANDALRGLDIRSTRSNLDAMIKDCEAIKARVLLIGMQVPPNYGKRYTDEFAKVFADTAQAHRVPLMPFLLKDVADRPDAKQWFQPDGLHPLAKAHPIIAKNVMGYLRPLLLRR